MFVLVLGAALASPAPAPPRSSASHTHVRRSVALVRAVPGHELQADELFSRRARRRFAAYLRMRLLEMREEGLDRAADAVERSRPATELLEPNEAASRSH